MVKLVFLSFENLVCDSQLYFNWMSGLWIFSQIKDTKSLKLIQFSCVGWRHSNPSHLVLRTYTRTRTCTLNRAMKWRGKRHLLSIEIWFFLLLSILLVLPAFLLDDCNHYIGFDVRLELNEMWTTLKPKCICNNKSWRFSSSSFESILAFADSF